MPGEWKNLSNSTETVKAYGIKKEWKLVVRGVVGGVLEDNSDILLLDMYDLKIEI